MILTYSFEHFKPLILNGTKIHTIRKDEHNRWKPGMKIQHWMHNPRNVAKNPHEFKTDVCVSIQYIHIRKGSVFISDKSLSIDIGLIDALLVFSRPLNKTQLEILAINDGFSSWEQMKKFFNYDCTDFKIIHWTDFKY